MRVEDFCKTRDFELLIEARPIHKQRDSFVGDVKFVQQLGHHFGSFQGLLCRDVKNTLAKLERQGTGRVLLSSFYARGVSGS